MRVTSVLQALVSGAIPTANFFLVSRLDSRLAMVTYVYAAGLFALLVLAWLTTFFRSTAARPTAPPRSACGLRFSAISARSLSLEPLPLPPRPRSRSWRPGFASPTWWPPPLWPC